MPCRAPARPSLLLSRAPLLPSPTPIALTGTIATIDQLSLRVGGSGRQLFVAAGESADGGPQSTRVLRSIAWIHPASVRGPCRHSGIIIATATRSVLPTSHGRALRLRPARALCGHCGAPCVDECGDPWRGLHGPSTGTRGRALRSAERTHRERNEA